MNRAKPALLDPVRAYQTARDAVILYRARVEVDRAQWLPALAGSLNNLANRCSEMSLKSEALEAASESAKLYRSLSAADRRTYGPDYATSLINLAATLGDMGRQSDALMATLDAVDLHRRLVAEGIAALQMLAGSLDNLGGAFLGVGRRDDAIQVAREAVGYWRRLVLANQGFLPDLGRSLSNLGVLLRAAGFRDEALTNARESVSLARDLVLVHGDVCLPGLAAKLDNLGGALSEVDNLSAAVDHTRESIEMWRRLIAVSRRSFLPRLVKSLNHQCAYLVALGRSPAAVVAARESVQLCIELAGNRDSAFGPELAASQSGLGRALGSMGDWEGSVAALQDAVRIQRKLLEVDSSSFQHDLARSLRALANSLACLGQHKAALGAAQECVQHLRELVDRDRRTHLAELATTLRTLACQFGEMGRLREALQAAGESVTSFRELVAGDRDAYLSELARSLDVWSCMLRETSVRIDRIQALIFGLEAAAFFRELHAETRQDVAPAFGRCLGNMSNVLAELGRDDEALEAGRDAVHLLRGCLAAERLSARTDLASALANLAGRLDRAGAYGEALKASREALALQREAMAANNYAQGPELARTLFVMASILGKLGRHTEALEAWRECGRQLLKMPPSNPNQWCQLAHHLTTTLDSAQDLRAFHLALLRRLTEHRELAWDSVHATMFLDLQGRLAAQVWELLGALPASEGDLLDEAVAALVSTLHSPDLARWLQAHGELAGLIRAVIEAEQLLDELIKRLSRGGGGDVDPGGRWQRSAERSGAAPDVDALARQRADDDQVIAVHAAVAQKAREAYRSERQHLIDTDPTFRSAFEIPDMQALREAAAHGQGGSLLCLLQLPTDSKDLPRTVGVLVHVGGRPTQRLEFPALHDVALHAELHQPRGSDRAHRGPLRGAPDDAVSAVSAAHLPPITDALRVQMRAALWQPLQRALDQAAADGAPVTRLHLCLHGQTQHLPLALREADDCPQLHVMAWPGLPYLRRGAASAPSASPPVASAPWLVGHDCAWGSEQPLPMAAVEAALLRRLLEDHGRTVVPIDQAAQVHGRAAGLVTCCHGGLELGRTRFDSALHLGQPLSVSQIVDQHLGPPLALLPACHAGETVDDRAGNALGIAAGFLLGGSRVVCASSKTVPDMLMPWYSTLMVWHHLHGLPADEAAQLARAQFAAVAFPEEFRRWLQGALPAAMATIEPNGHEDRFIRGDAARVSVPGVVAAWPWQGASEELLSADPDQRKAANERLAAGVLLPPSDRARELAEDLREVAAFVFVYGVG